ncbi:hypothetical protein [Halobaculum limi]|uniref:hypothetical protein n=1 Tax=Halobaculum limi TaxID=3031916 RepID=UPI002404CE99|nr:hypothetical protein [Halobaculum sp. YSMS11]
MSATDPAKRIPKSIGTETKLFGSYTLTDLAVALTPGVVVILLTQVLLPSTLTVGGYQPQTLTLPLAAVGIALGVTFVYLTPSYTTSLNWFVTFLGYHRSVHDLPHEDAKQYTQIERVHPEEGLLERTDGAFVGVVQVDPPAMALATRDEWAAKAHAFEEFCNTVVEFPIQIFSTTQPFPVDEFLATYEARLGDADVKSNPRLAALIEHYLDWYAFDLAERRMTIRDHYVVVPVTSGEVRYERESLIQKLAVVPVLGVFIDIWLAPSVDDQRVAMIAELDDRLRRVEAGLREIDGCAATRVDCSEATELLAAFWAGEQREYENMEQVLRTRPLVHTPSTIHDDPR